MRKTRRWLLVLVAVLLALAALPAQAMGTALEIPNPEGAGSAVSLGEMERAEAQQGYVNCVWKPAFSADWTAEMLSEWAQSFQAWYETQCLAMGYASAGNKADENGFGFYYYQAGDTTFALYLSAATIQLMIPANATLSALPEATAEPEATFSFDSLVQADPTPVPTVEPATNWYVRGTYNGEPTEFRLTSVGRSKLAFTDDTGRHHINYMKIQYDRKFVLYESYRIDNYTSPPGFNIFLKTHGGKYVSFDTDWDFDLFSDLPTGDYVELCFTTIEDKRMAGTLSFSLGGGRYVLEDGEFLGSNE